MITTLLLLVTASAAAEPLPLPGFPNSLVVLSTSIPTAQDTVEAPKPAEAPKPVEAPKVVEAAKTPVLLPPAIPERPKGTLDTAGEVARDLAVRVEYFEKGQAYYRAYIKGTHTSEENKAFLGFLESYDAELGIAKRTHAILGMWLEKKSAIKD